MDKRRDRQARPALEGLEWRLAPSGMGPGPGGGRHDAVDVDAGDRGDGDRGDRDRGDRDRGQDNGNWEPMPIVIGRGLARPS